MKVSGVKNNDVFGVDVNVTVLPSILSMYNCVDNLNPVEIDNNC